MDRENVIKGLEELYGFLFREYANIPAEESKIYYDRTCAIRDALAMLKEQEDLGTELTNAVELIHKKNERIEKLLKEQEEQKRAWLQSIADNQLANSPMGYEDEGQLRYKSGLWNGLQMAYEIITAGDKQDG